jgi:hypothetical protein
MLAKQNTWLYIGSHKRLHQTQSNPPINLGDNQIKRVNVTKSLGLMIDGTLIWDEHGYTNYEKSKRAEIKGFL